MTEMVNVVLENEDTVQVTREYAESMGLTVVDGEGSPENTPDLDPFVAIDHTLVRVRLADGAEVTMGRSHAASLGLTELDKPAVDGFGAAYPAKPHITLRGGDLDRALEAAGLSTSGKLADKQARLAEFQSSDAAASANINTEGVSL